MFSFYEHKKNNACKCCIQFGKQFLDLFAKLAFDCRRRRGCRFGREFRREDAINLVGLEHLAAVQIDEFKSVAQLWSYEQIVGPPKLRVWRRLGVQTSAAHTFKLRQVLPVATCAYMQMKMSIEPEVCTRVQKAATADQRVHFVLRRPTRRNKLHIGALLNYRKSRATRPSQQRPPTISIDACSSRRRREPKWSAFTEFEGLLFCAFLRLCKCLK